MEVVIALTILGMITGTLFSIIQGSVKGLEADLIIPGHIHGKSASMDVSVGIATQGARSGISLATA